MSYDPFRTDHAIAELAADELPGTSEHSMLASIAKRLGALETETKTLKSQLRDKDDQIQLLQSQNTDLKNALLCHGDAVEDADGIDLFDSMEATQIENQRCKRQITEMELFLADYGKLGQPTDEILTELLSFDAEEIQSLHEAGVG